jgi:serine/threonine protein kinase
MFDVGSIINGRYRVEGLCSKSGGMGEILFVTSLNSKLGFEIVLKYCRDVNDESLRRFRREVRLLSTFKGNSKVVQIVDQDLDHNPPYFVMKYYPEGDLCKLTDVLRGSYEVQEKYFLQMIDCIEELHSKGTFHRDIKPQNFLIDSSEIVVSDFGLTTEIGSDTAFTRSSVYWEVMDTFPPNSLTEALNMRMRPAMYSCWGRLYMSC